MAHKCIRRMKVLLKILSNENFGAKAQFCTGRMQRGKRKVIIDDVEKVISDAKNPEFVPHKYLKEKLNQEELSHLRWMLQKENMKQDIFLIGRPGISRRNLAMAFLELTCKEYEYVSLSRDTTEADLKQRREIINSSAKYIDQSAVRAATQGRALVLEGIEKAERNVLPVLNNLLENREMHLEDGRFLIESHTYDKLLEKHGEAELKKWHLTRVSEDFRVIALGLPVPAYQGNALDPPLRSRFQARNIAPPLYEDLLDELQEKYPELDARLPQLLSVAFALSSVESRSLGLPDFPLENIEKVAAQLVKYPDLSVSDAVKKLYPYSIFVPRTEQNTVENLIKDLLPSESKQTYKVLDFTISDNLLESMKVSISPSEVTLNVPSGSNASRPTESQNFIFTPYLDHTFASILLSHSTSDFCIVGPKGCGKSAIIRHLANKLNYQIEPVVLYRDITSRDLIQQRTTLPNGDTVWQNSPLVTAALEGKLAVLDGIHRVHPSTLCLIHRLVHDRELQLYNGERLLRHDRYDALAEKFGESYLTDSKIFRIHPAFRIVALAESPGGDIPQWLTSELLSLFLFHEMRPLNLEEETFIMQSLFNVPAETFEGLLYAAEHLRTAKDPALSSLANFLSTRQLLRTARKCSTYRHTSLDVYDIIQNACMAKFLPPLTKHSLDTILKKLDIIPRNESFATKFLEIREDTVTIGDTTVPRYKTEAKSKVPQVLFYDVPQHLNLLEKLMQDFSVGEHILLVGNQGVGKNKVTDRLLELLNRPREYIQLHRDTTVQSLTVQPSLVGGVVRYEDSPLVQAVKSGHVLVIDEADKAPTHVTCILKTLIESGEMILSDRRRIVPNTDPRAVNKLPDIIPIHPDFRIIMLANRPGFPFLGNDLFSSFGDLLSCHIVDNPNPESERMLLKSYGPDVSDTVIDKLIKVFGKLRELSDQNLVSYPYSTREAINITKHLQTFPNDDISDALGNVFDFDGYSENSLEVLSEVFFENGIPTDILTKTRKTKVGTRRQLTIERDSGLDTSGPKHGKVDKDGNPHVGGNTWAGGTGGRDTAGLGGKGGPYRLDAGHDVHQLSDEEKANVPKHVLEAARKMNRETFKKRLQEIQMSEYDAKVYEEYSSAVAKEVQALKIILSSLQAKSKEREWSRHQTSGELDDAKLIEGITGEQAIYRRRTEPQPDIPNIQQKPKRLKLVVDVSASMYRFNGYDGRMIRQMEAVVLVLEALAGHEDRIKVDIVGHSGEDDDIVFFKEDNPPKNNKERLELLKTMHAHSQFCYSGDNTLQAIKNAVTSLAKDKDKWDEAIVVVFSDAHLTRYRIAPSELSQALQSEPSVNAFAIFIGSQGNNAEMLLQALPVGKGFICMDLSNIPKILQQIFSSALLNTR
nr:PREDICTED: von Willebrand factor A domain-containing protein 8 [Bemisia tabaci]